jgi:hypothetical protein
MAKIDKLDVTEEDIMAASGIPGQPDSDPIYIALKRTYPEIFALGKVLVCPVAILYRQANASHDITPDLWSKLPQIAQAFITAYDQGAWEQLNPISFELDFQEFIPTRGPTVVNGGIRAPHIVGVA